MPGPTLLQPTRSCCRCFSPPLAVRHCRGIGSASPHRFISPHVHAMPSLTPRSPAPLALRRPSHGKPVAFLRPPASSRGPTLISAPRNPSALHSKTVEAFVLVKPVGGRWMHLAVRFSHTRTVPLANQNVVKNSARLFVLVNRMKGQLKCSWPAIDTPLRFAYRSLEAIP